ncbi:hypothetical protein [Pseudoalteromonas sp. Z9A6]|uniref:hypothetical protein n=1 Tax=Pseudoalteromonas sp. Z9A6 TaxID=2686352 RepID=UPI0013FE2A87|nr:hypothetical protein [Pseudoalteromonas sp. Z9A6]
MPNATCKVWGCSNVKFNTKYSQYCKQHRESAHHNGHPTFKPPALSRRYASYDQELALGFNGGKQWYEEAELDDFNVAFSRLLDEAEALKPLSQYRRLGDLPIKQQLLYLLKHSVERVGRRETMKQWLCIYLTASNRKSLFPNRKTFAVFVCRKSCLRRVRMPKHKTPKGNLRGYRLNANRAVKMLSILEPVLTLAFISANDVALWYRHFANRLILSNASKEVFAAKHKGDPEYARSLTRLRIIKSIHRKYLVG